MTVLILGAGFMQKPAIESAKELGYKTIIFDGNENAYCKDICDSFFVIDLKDTEALVKKATEIHQITPLSAVFTAGTDFSFAVARIANACNLLSHTEQAAKNASDKILMRSCFSKKNVPSPNFMEFSCTTSQKNIAQFLEKNEFPIVVKPCDNMGGRGCRLVRTKKELASAIDDAMQNSKTQRAIVEQYMEGPEFSIDALVCNNEITITGFADRHVYFPPYFIEMGHSMPTMINTKDYNALIKTFVEGIIALGLHHGAAKADIKLTKNGPMIGEIAGRLSGGYMSGWTFPLASDLNLTKQGLLIALGKNPTELEHGRVEIKDIVVRNYRIFDYPCKRHCVERAWVSIPGKIKRSNVIEDLDNFVFPRVTRGMNVKFPMNNVEKAGNIIAVSQTREAAEKITHEYIKNVYLELEHTQETKIFLDTDLSIDYPPNAYVLPKSIYKELIENPNVESSVLPSFLKDYASVCDWNGITLEEAFEILTILNPGKPVKLKALIRGGIQGALFSNN